MTSAPAGLNPRAPVPEARPQVGVFGGTFDPVHLGHVELAKAATEQLGLHELLWVPAGSPWQKRAPASSAEHRVAMLELVIREASDALQGGAAGRTWRIDERELKRQGPSYTIDTVEALLAQRPSAQLWLIIGADQWARLHTWHRHEELKRLVHWAVVPRDDASLDVASDASGSGLAVRLLSMPPRDISSTVIRARLRAGQSIEGLVSPLVASYIDQHGLYRPA